MGTFFIYILKTAFCLSLLYLFYRLLLSRETFYRFNRVALLGILVLSSLIPFVEVTTKEHTELHQAMQSIEQVLTMPEEVEMRMAPMVVPIDSNYRLDEENTLTVENGNTIKNKEGLSETFAISWVQLMLLIYLGGILFFFLRNVYSLLKLLLLLKSGEFQKTEDGTSLVVHEQMIAPFSWMKYIVISRKDLEENGREILIHEKAHINNGHSWDLLVADICIFFQWFNPGVWLLKQELQNVHEYEADETVIREGVNAKEYQLLLIKKAVGTRLYSMANSFNHGKLKKRITMMLKKKSSPWARLKYLYVLPLAAVAVTAFAQPEISEKVEEVAATKIEDLTTIKGEELKVNPVEDFTEISVEEVMAEMKEHVSVEGSIDTIQVKEPWGTSIKLQGVTTGKEPLIVIDGKEADVTLLNVLMPAYIKRLSFIAAKDAGSKYGKKGNNGIVKVELYTKEEVQKNEDSSSAQFLKKCMEAAKTGEKSSHSVMPEKKQKIVFIDGKESSMKVAEAVNAFRVKRWNYLTEAEAVDYGKKGENGVTQITLWNAKAYQAKEDLIKSKRAINAWEYMNALAEVAFSDRKMDTITYSLNYQPVTKEEMKRQLETIPTDSLRNHGTSSGGDEKRMEGFVNAVTKEYFAQEMIQVKGSLKDDSGNPIPYASIFPKGIPSGTYSYEDGHFTIYAPKNGTLQITAKHINKDPVEIKVAPELEIVMKNNI